MLSKGDIVSDEYSELLLLVVHVDLHHLGNVVGPHKFRGILAWVKVCSICVFFNCKHFYLQVFPEPGRSLSNLLVHSDLRGILRLVLAVMHST